MARTLLFLVLLCSCTALLTCTNGGDGGAGLRMKLTHVDARGNYTDEELVRRAVAVGRQRLAVVDAMASGGGGGGVGVPVHWATLQYVAEYLIGDPPQRAEALVDTGSDLVWTQCSTCLRRVCAKQTLPYYNSSASSSFAPVPCKEKLCAASDLYFCALDGGCSVIASYGAGSIVGFLGTEAFSFQSGTAELAFGCVTFTIIFPGALQGSSGLIGLGRGRLSLVSQTGAKKFSYCLTRYFHNNGASGHLFVGASASLGGGDGPVMTTPFVKGPKGSPFYYLPLVGLTVGKTRLPIPSTVFDLREIAPGVVVGGVIIDSGTPFTSLVPDAYDALAAELTAQLNGSLVPVPPPGDGSAVGAGALCVARRDVDRVVPTLVFHFRGGADMALPPENYWAPADKATACMAIYAGGRYRSLIGNFQQQNMHVLYDLANGEFSFQAAECSAL
ncbi:aspartic proteinase nepenthesin-1-like [Oryza brachyantha]|uniref:aspartic proteinase nepenthesin-1-like n=1 Tax=Oryza brachyantha TaxID=4533 RepID=UPI001ADB83AA|nr:aspartic proteinase nepenthesin-1-like [Oryza brachyantha]